MRLGDYDGFGIYRCTPKPEGETRCSKNFGACNGCGVCTCNALLAKNKRRSSDPSRYHRGVVHWLEIPFQVAISLNRGRPASISAMGAGKGRSVRHVLQGKDHG